MQNGEKLSDEVPMKTKHIERESGNAFNRFGDLSYWYQEMDLINIGRVLFKDREDVEFIGAIGSVWGTDGTIVGAKRILREHKDKLIAERKLVGIYNTGGSHWISFIIFRDQGGKVSCRYKDSLGHVREDFERDVREAFGEGIDISCLAKNEAEQTEELDNAIARNKGLVSCGVFALKNMEILAGCGSVDECEKVRYYRPYGEREYEKELRIARSEYGLLYGRRVYEELEETDPKKRVGELLTTLEVDRLVVDKGFLIEFLKELGIDAKVIEEVLRSSREVDVLVEAKADKLVKGKVKTTENQEESKKEGGNDNTLTTRIDTEKELPLLDKDGQIKAALELWLKAAEEVHPDVIIEMLEMVHNIQVHWGIPELTKGINDCFIKCIPYINGGYTKDEPEYSSVGLGLVDKRLDFLTEQAERKRVLIALKEKPGIKEWGTFRGLLDSTASSSNSTIAELNVKHSIPEDYNEALRERGDVLAEYGEYEAAAKYYDMVRQDPKEQGMRRLRASYYP